MPIHPSPRHCADEYDERSWVSADLDRWAPHSRDHHDLVAAAREHLHRWLTEVLTTLRTAKIGPVGFPASTGRALSGYGQVVDPSLTYLLLCRARLGATAEPADALYIAVVTRDPATRWRGLTGFYLPYCGTCDTDPRTVAADVADWLPDDATVNSPHRLPPSIRPAPDWFERRMLLGAHLPSPVDIRSLDPDWSTWPRDHAAPPKPALACVGSLEIGRHNLLFLDDARADLPALQLALDTWRPGTQPGHTRIPYRAGPTAGLLDMAGGLRSSPAPTDLVTRVVGTGPSRSQPPLDWGAVTLADDNDFSSVRITASLRHTVRTMRTTPTEHGASRIVLRYWKAGEGILSFRHLRALEGAQEGLNA